MNQALPYGLERSIFSNCWNLAETLTLPATLTSFLVDCSALKHLTLEEGITQWGSVNAPNLETLILPMSLNTGGGSVGSDRLCKVVLNGNFDLFAHFNQIKPAELIFREGTTEINGTYISSPTLSVSIPEGVKKISYESFLGRNRTPIKKLVLPSTIEFIAYNAFGDFAEELHIPVNVLPHLTEYIGGGYTLVITGDYEELPDYNIASTCGGFDHLVLQEGLTKLCDYALKSWGNSYKSEITLPSSLKEIGNYAFQNTYLSSIKLPDGLESIGDYAFTSAYNLKEIVIPDSVKTLGEEIFSSASDLERITMSGEFKDDCYADTTEHFGRWSTDQDVTLVISDGSEFIGAGAFQNTWFTHVIIPSSVKEIRMGAFNWCQDLKSVEIAYGVETLQQSAFQQCTSLTSVTLPDSVTECGNSYIFNGCRKLKEVKLSKNITVIGSGMFTGCSALESIDLSNIERIGESAFEGCYNLKEANLTNVTRIGSEGFYGCSGLKNVVFSEACSLADYAFRGCSSLKSIVLPGNISWYGDGTYQFMNCTALETVTFASGDYWETRIFPGMFSGCTALKKVSLPSQCNIIDEKAFDGCTSLKEIDIACYELSIGTSAFRGCTSLEKLPMLVSSTLTIGESAFDGCTALNAVTFPVQAITSIGTNAFMGCTALTRLSLPVLGQLQMADAALAGLNNLEELHYKGYDSEFDSIFLGNPAPARLTVYTDKDIPFYSFMTENYPDVPLVTSSGQEYTVTFVSNGGTPVEPLTVAAGELIPQPVVPNRYGFRFLGWYEDADLYNRWRFNLDIMQDNDMVLYAGWEYAFMAETEESSDGVVLTKLLTPQADMSIPASSDGKTVVGLGSQLIGSTVETLYLPATIRQIAPDTFIHASSLTEITVDEDNPSFYSSDGVLYSRDGTLVCYPQSRQAAAFAVPAGTVRLAANAFCNTGFLTELTLPASLTTLGSRAINDCWALETLRFAADPTTLGTDALLNLTNTMVYGPLSAPLLTAYADAAELHYNEYVLAFVSVDQAVLITIARAGELLPGMAAPTRSGYVLKGWTTQDSSTLWNPEKDLMPAQDLTLYAAWTEAFEWKLDGEQAILTRYNGSAAEVELPELLDGWYVTDIAPGCFDAVPDITLVGGRDSLAQRWAEANGFTFRLKTYTLYFKSMGQVIYGPFEYAADDLITFPEDPTREGYQFYSWRNSNGTYIGGNVVMPAHDETFFASWDKVSSDETYDNLYYQETEDGVIITGGYNLQGELTIPAALNGKPVVAIAERAFADSELTSVIIPDSVVQIAPGAFRSCEKLTDVKLGSGIRTLESNVFYGCLRLCNVTIGAGLTTIEDNAFAMCTALQALTLPATVKDVSAYAFEDCCGLAELSVESGSKDLKSIDGVLFTADGKTLLYYPPARIGDTYTIPDGTEAIAPGAMRSTSLSSLTCPSTLKTVGSNALQNSGLLHELIIPETGALSEVGSYAFAGCKALSEVAFPDGLDSIGERAFVYCPIMSAELGKQTKLGVQAFTPVPGMTLTGGADSSAAAWADQNNVRFIDPAKDIPMTALIGPENLEIEPGKPLQMDILLQPANTTETEVTYTTSDPTIATVDENGVITPVMEGVCTITATAAHGAYTVSTSVYVRLDPNAIPIEQFYLPYFNVCFAETGNTYTLNTVILPAETTEDKTVTWASSDTTVVSCGDSDITTHKPGVVTLTVSLNNGMSDSLILVVQDQVLTMELPASLLEIEAEAFSGTSLNYVVCNEGLETIGELAFANSPGLYEIVIPSSVTSIADNAFENCGEILLIYCYSGSEAARYAQQHDFFCYYLD